jgi:hypothetical protein
MKTSANGALIMSGAGVAAVRKKLEEEFEKARGLEVPCEAPAEPLVPEQTIYTVQQETRFHERAKRLSLAALASPHILPHDKKGVWNIEAPSETVENLYKAALGRNE